MSDISLITPFLIALTLRALVIVIKSSQDVGDPKWNPSSYKRTDRGTDE